METDVYIQSTASVLPQRVLSNHEMTELLMQRSPGGVSRDKREHFLSRAEQTEAKTGIRERRFFEASETPVSIGRTLITNLTEHGIDWTTLDAVLVASASIQGFPGLSQRIVAELRSEHPELGHPFVLDISSNACTSFLYGIGLGVALIRAFGYHNVLCLSIETSSRCIRYDIEDFAISTLFGDAAAGMLLSAERGFARIDHVRMGSHITSDTLPLIQGSGALAARPDLEIAAEARWEVAGPKVAIGAVPLLADEIRFYQGYSVQLDWLAPHQANLRGIMAPACKKAGFPVKQMLTTIDFAANTSTASVPLTFDYHHRQRRFRPGDRILLVSFGASFTVASALVEILPCGS